MSQLFNNQQTDIMHKVELLDVTLRDGGLTNNFDFSPEITQHILTELDQSGIGHIEIGFRNGLLGAAVPGMGPAGMCATEYLNICRKLIRSSKMTVMFHPKNVQKNDFEVMRDCGVDSVRMCFGPGQDFDMSQQTMLWAKECGLEAFFNIMYVSKYTLDSLRQLVREVAKHVPRAIYLADSAGNLTPDKISQLFAALQQETQIDFGFHGHDSLFLAQANALAAVNCGVKYIDASLSGLGAGVGNLHMEGIVSLFRSQGCTDYAVAKILALADYVNLKVRHSAQSLPLKAMITGIFNLSKQDISYLENVSDIEAYYAEAEEYIKKNASA